MKAIEFNAHGPARIPAQRTRPAPRVPRTQALAPVSAPPSPVMVKEQSIAPVQMSSTPRLEEDYNVAGIHVKPGHSIHRHRARNSELWHRMRNWD